MDSTRTSVHLSDKARPEFYRPTDMVPGGAIKLGETVIYPPYRRADAVEFYRALMAVAAEAICALGAEENCVRT